MLLFRCFLPQRCLQMATVAPETSEIINKQLLKSRSGEFDVESIHTISLRDAGLTDLGCISECTSLERLDLSYNSIARLHKLAGLTALTKLNLCANRITSLEGLQSLDNLQGLNVSGNLIGSVDSLRCLAGLDKLTSLRVQEPSCGLSNPMCNTPYVQDLLKLLPVLITLDGQRVRGRGSELFQMCQDVERKLSNLSSVKNIDFDEDVGDAITTQQWVIDVQAPLDKAVEAEQNLKAMLEGCSMLCREAKKTLEEAEIERSVKATDPTDS